MNTGETILVVLGYPASDNGTPGPILQARLDKAIELYRSGVAGKMIVTGGAIGNEFVEAEVMAVYCIRQGIAPENIYLETQARNTYDNARMVKKMMEERGYKNAIVVTSDFHRLRARTFFDRVLPGVQIVPAPFPEGYSFLMKWILIAKEYLIIILFYSGVLNKRYGIR